MVDIVPGKAMALDVVTAGGTLTVINVHGPGSCGDFWPSKDSFWGDVAMYAAAKSARGTKAVLFGGDFNVWLESLGHPTTRRFQAPWEPCGFHKAGAAAEEVKPPSGAGHRLDSFMLNSPLTRGRCVSARTWRREGLLRHWRLTTTPWSSTSHWR